MKTPLLSICIPAYSNPTGLLSLVESTRDLICKLGVEAQVELCISDDASPDSSGAQTISQRTWPMPVRVDMQEQNLGFSKNLLHTAHMAQGEYLAFVGDDDVFDEAQFAPVLELLKSGEPLFFFRTMPDVPLVEAQASTRISDPTTNPETVQNAADLPMKLGVFHATFIGNFIVQRKAFLAHSQTADTLSLYPHYAALLRMLDQHPARYIPRPLLVFNGGGARWNQPLLSAIDLPQLFTRHFKKDPSSKSMLRIFYAKQVRSIPRACLNWRKGRKVDFGNHHQSLSLANVLSCYEGSLYHQFMALGYWLAGRLLPLSLLLKLIGERARKTHFEAQP